MTDNEKNSATAMSDNEIIKALECDTHINCEECPYWHEFCEPNNVTAKDVLDLINRMKADKEALIAGQETLQKALAEKSAEVENLKKRDETAEKIIREQGGTILHLKNENSRLFDRNFELSEKGEKAVIACIAARAEAIKEFAEKLKEALPMECRTVVEGNDMEGITDTGFQEDDTMTTIDNLVKEMVGDAE